MQSGCPPIALATWSAALATDSTTTGTRAERREAPVSRAKLLFEFIRASDKAHAGNSSAMACIEKPAAPALLHGPARSLMIESLLWRTALDVLGFVMKFSSSRTGRDGCLPPPTTSA